MLLVDGRLDEPEWSNADPATGFRQQLPDEGAPASSDTHVRILHDERTVYIGATLYDPQPELVRISQGRRDYFNSADWFTVALDTYNDNRTAFYFAVNAAGIHVDGVKVDGTQSERVLDLTDALLGFDPSWDAHWQAAARVDSSGWTVEMAIPISEVEVARPGGKRWGINFMRTIARKAELDSWALLRTQDASAGAIMHFGTLILEGEIRPSMRRNALMRLDSFRDPDDDSDHNLPFTPLGGTEAELALTPALVLQAALLPDFSPVGFDELLKATSLKFRTSYSRLFATTQHLLSTPSVLGNAPFSAVTLADDSPLLGSAAVHGRLPGGLTSSANWLTSLHDVGRLTHSPSARLQKSLGPRSVIGVAGTMGPYGPVNTVDVESGELVFENEYVFQPSTIAMDWDLHNRDGTVRLTGQGSASRERELLVRRTTFLTKDPRTRQYMGEEKLRQVVQSKGGYAARLQVEQLSREWNWLGRVEVVSPNYRVGPHGSTGFTDRLVLAAGLRHINTNGKTLFRRLQMEAELSQWFTINRLKSREILLSGHVSALSRAFHRVLLSTGASLGAVDHWALVADLAVASDVRRTWTVVPRVSYAARSRASDSWHVSGTYLHRILPRITIGAAIGLLGGRGPTSLVTAIDAYRLPYGSQPNSFSYLQATIGARHAQRRQDFAIGQALAPSGFAVGYASEAEGQRNVYGRVGGVVALTKRIDVEFGAALSSSGNVRGNSADRKLVVSRRADMVAGIQVGVQILVCGELSCNPFVES